MCILQTKYVFRVSKFLHNTLQFNVFSFVWHISVMKCEIIKIFLTLYFCSCFVFKLAYYQILVNLLPKTLVCTGNDIYRLRFFLYIYFWHLTHNADYYIGEVNNLLDNRWCSVLSVSTLQFSIIFHTIQNARGQDHERFCKKTSSLLVG